MLKILVTRKIILKLYMVTVVIMTFVQYIQISDQYTVPLKLYNVTCQLFPPPKKKKIKTLPYGS